MCTNIKTDDCDINVTTVTDDKNVIGDINDTDDKNVTKRQRKRKIVNYNVDNDEDWLPESDDTNVTIVTKKPKKSKNG